MLQLADMVAIETGKIKSPPNKKQGGGSMHPLASLLLLLGLDSVVGLTTALGERTEPQTGHLSILKARKTVRLPLGGRGEGQDPP